MATYKVLQDIEAEDKLLGPLTLKQFIFAAIFIGLGFINFMTITSAAPSFVKLFVFTVTFPFMLVLGFLAAPLGRDQPNDIWLLAQLRFLFKPRRRIWDQDGMNDLVTITAPKHDVQIYTNGLDQTEVTSRLHALASTMDSRGWAIKNVTTNLYSQPGYLSPGAVESDRLVSPSELPQDVAPVNIQASDDMLDTSNNPIAQHLDQMVKDSAQTQRVQAIGQMKQTNQQPTQQDYWFMNQPQAQPSTVPQDYSTFTAHQVVMPGATDEITSAAEESAEEKALGEKLAAQHKDDLAFTHEHIKTLQPLHDSEGNPLPKPATNDQPAPQTTPPNPAILGLAQNNDLNVATIARQAKKLDSNDGEVVISLH